jgi:hypothetical protein
MRNISFGIIFTIYTVSTTKIKQNILAWSMRLRFALIKEKTKRTTSNGFHLEEMRQTRMFRKCKISPHSWRYSILIPKIELAI